MCKFPAILLLLITMSSCVSMKSYRQTKAELLGMRNGYSAMEAQMDALRARNATLEEEYSKLYREGKGGNARTAELEALLRQRDQALAKIRSVLDDALSGFAGRGLSVTQQGGMIYVSMDEKLLFDSGKADVSEGGKSAIREIASVLADNPGINITVEGHTDNVPYRSKGGDQIVDNWDLSTKRATEVIRLMLNNKGVDPQRITASGRSQYVPVATGNTAAARQQNRRTEIILTPRLDRLMELMNQAAGDGGKTTATTTYDEWDD